MIKSVLPNKDATIYERYINRNTGIDSMIEIGRDSDDEDNAAKRLLLQFNTSEIQSKIVGQEDIKFNLNLYVSEQYEIPENYTIYTYPISQQWDMGVGKFYNDPQTTEGVTWRTTGNTDWIISGSLYSGSYNIESGGGSWNSNYEVTQSMVYESDDVSFDVTNIVNSWLSGSIDNYGFIAKVDEYNLSSVVDSKYFSRETHTIYQPRLFIQYLDDEFNTGSLVALSENKQYTLSIKNLKYTYKTTETPIMYMHVREKYPTMTYRLSNEYLINNYLPINSYYSIIDGSSETIIIPFSEYTKISLDSAIGNYFTIDMSNFYEERNYKIIFKIVWSDNNVNIYDNNIYFKVIR